MNNEARRVPVTFTRNSNTNYQVNIPGRNLLPPGNYFLFAMDAAGVPSVASMIKIMQIIQVMQTLQWYRMALTI